MKVVGYTNRLSVSPGETIDFMVHAEDETFRADIVRLIHGDTNPEGPGFKEALVETTVSGTYAGQRQVIQRGSYVHVPNHPGLQGGDLITLQTWLWPTAPEKGEQALMSKGRPGGAGGYGLVIDSAGCLGFWLSDGAGRVERHSTGAALNARQWYFAAATYDSRQASVRLVQIPLSRWPREASRADVTYKTRLSKIGQTDVPFLMAAHAGESIGQTQDHYDGKLDSPRILLGAFTDAASLAARAGSWPTALGLETAAEWDFGCDFSTAIVSDVSGHGHHGRAVNMPARAVTGHNWTGDQTDFNQAPDQYRAIHFHSDDLEDAGWPAAFSLTIPSTLPSGVYAARLRSDGGEDHVPFFVRPARGRANAPILFLAPTLSYLAYGNYHLEASAEGRGALEQLAGRQLSFDYPVDPPDRYMVEQDLLSLYEKHADGSGTYYVSQWCPQMTLRPKYRHPALGFGAGAPHQVGADLHLLDWMEVKSFAFDVATDHDLHAEGQALLERYRVMMTGTHPEYWTAQMLTALEAYLAGGGRLMYMGGNGFYWVTSLDLHRPHIVEVRRWAGSQSWRVAPGEEFHSTTGERGGLWRNRGRPPQRLVGVGFTAQGFDASLPLQRLPDSLDPRVAFVFKGVDAGDPIGARGLVMGGAAGYEIDRADTTLGTPRHALRLAVGAGFSDVYQHAVEEVDTMNPRQGGRLNPFVQADMVYFEGNQGGAVFSVGSIAWCGSLSQNNYDNSVSRITENVLSAFASAAGPQPPGLSGQ